MFKLFVILFKTITYSELLSSALDGETETDQNGKNNVKNSITSSARSTGVPETKDFKQNFQTKKCL